MSLVNKIKSYFWVSAVQQTIGLPNLAIAINLLSAGDYVGGGYCAFAGLFNESLAVRQYVLMNRLENAIEKHGYDPRLAKLFMETYCGRKIVKKVLEKNNLSEEYKSLIE